MSRVSVCLPNTNGNVDLERCEPSDHFFSSRFICFVTCLWLSLPVLSTTTHTLPLIYHQRDGYYAIQLKIGNDPKQVFNAVVDTGSSNLNLIGDKQICPKCMPYSPGNRLQINGDIHVGKRRYDIAYMLGIGRLREYESSVYLSPRLALDGYQFGAYTEAKNVSNIVGFGLIDIAAPSDRPMTPLFYALDRQYGFDGQFSLILRGLERPAQLVLGPSRVSSLRHSYSFDGYSEYLIPHTGVYDNQDQLIVHTSAEGKSLAVIDSGTGGRLIYPSPAYQAIVRYIKQHVTGKYRDLPQSFWQSKSCAPVGYIDVNQFPALKLGFEDTNGQLHLIDLPPSGYLTHDGCYGDTRHFAFARFPDFPRSVHRHQQREKSAPFAILGTPFLEQVTATFDLKNNTIRF